MKLILRKEIGNKTYYLDKISPDKYTIDCDGKIIHDNLSKGEAIYIFNNIK